MSSSPFVPAFGPRRSPPPRKGDLRILFLATASFVLLAPSLTDSVRFSLALTLTGLVWDITGAITLAIGLMQVAMARLRQASERGVTIECSLAQRMPLWIALQFGSREPQDTESYTLEELTETFYGVALLVSGFAFQFGGALLGSVGW